MNKRAIFLPLLLAGTLTACGGDDPQAAPDPTAAPTRELAESGSIPEAEARAAALAAAGPGATLSKVEVDDVDDRPVYKYRIKVAGGERDVSVDRSTGEVVKNEAAEG